VPNEDPQEARGWDRQADIRQAAAARETVEEANELDDGDGTQHRSLLSRILAGLRGGGHDGK
jgi:hypothetical protein